MRLIKIVLALVMLAGCGYQSGKEGETTTIDTPTNEEMESIYNELYINFIETELSIGYRDPFVPDMIIKDYNGVLTLPEVDNSMMEAGTFEYVYVVASEEYPELSKEYTILVEREPYAEIYSQYRNYTCYNSDFLDYFENDIISVVLNPDGNIVNINFAVGNGRNEGVYYGAFRIIEENLFSYGGNFYEDARFLLDANTYENKMDGYFKLSDNKLYFLSKDLTLEEMREYTAENYCVLNE